VIFFRKKRIHQILAKDEEDRDDDDKLFLEHNKKYSKIAESSKKYQNAKKDREKEIEDDPETLELKCQQLVEMMNDCEKIVIYTGAGISTSASIPDYRGPNGVWTQLAKGCHVPRVADLVYAEPTYTHMAIAELVRRKIVSHVVSQNCDGLHVRSGLAARALSEIHGNMYMEVCKHCKSPYWRTFDVTEKTGLRRHSTGRICRKCVPKRGKKAKEEALSECSLIDTIVHFGERGKLKVPLNWDGAARAVKNADMIICLGSSLKVLKTYACLWPKKGTVKLVIVNLQWTPKDSAANLKINGKCDEVLEKIMTKFELLPKTYLRQKDPILMKATPLTKDEQDTTSRVKMEQVLEQMGMEVDMEGSGENIITSSSLTPGWFGKGLKMKIKLKQTSISQSSSHSRSDSPTDSLTESPTDSPSDSPVNSPKAELQEDLEANPEVDNPEMDFDYDNCAGDLNIKPEVEALVGDLVTHLVSDFNETQTKVDL